MRSGTLMPYDNEKKSYFMHVLGNIFSTSMVIISFIYGKENILIFMVGWLRD